MGQRSRKRGRREKPPTPPTAAAARRSEFGRRSEERNASVRAALVPLAPGERPWSIKIGALLAALSGGSQLLLFLFGVKLKVAGTHPKAGSTIVFAGLMFVCAGGMWMLRYWAVLGFMALLAITLLAFSLSLIKASSILGVVISLAVIVGGGFLFLKLVRVLSRIQMPKYPGP